MNRGYEYRGRIGPDGRGLSLLAYLAGRYRHSSPQAWETRILAGSILLDDGRPEPTTMVRPGQMLVWKRPGWVEPPAPLSFAILHRDRHLLALLKPAGLPTLPGGGYLDHTLLSLVRRCYPGASPAHRIGRGTTGLVLCSRTPEAAAGLSAAWRRGLVRKFYRALVAGLPARESFAVDAPIGRLRHRFAWFQAHAAAATGKPSLSHVRVLEARQGAALVEVEIVTGRPHQVRIHLAAAGHPLLGDPFYGPGGQPLPGTESFPGDGGFFLHAHRLVLGHPITGRLLEIEAPPPRTLRLSHEA